MIAALALAFVLPSNGAQQAFAHAAHHSGAPTLYLECADVGAMLDAYTNAAAPRMLRDEAVKSSFAKVADALGVDVGSVLDGALAPLGLEASADSDPLAELLARARTARSLSLSFAFEQAAPDEMAQALESLTSAVAKLDRVSERVEAHAEQANGVPPASLEALSLPAELATDPWGHPWSYTTTTEGEFALLTLGRDGALGGEGVDADLALDTDLAQVLEAEVVRRLGARLVVEFNSPESAAAAVEWLQRFAEFTDVAPSPSTARWSVKSFPGASSSKAPNWIARSGATVIAAMGRVDLAQIEAATMGKSASLATTKLDVQLASRLGSPRGVSVTSGFFDGRTLAALLANPELAVRSASSLLLNFGEAQFVWRLQLVGERFSNDLLWLGKREDSLLGLLGDKPAPAEALRYVPSDAVGFFAAHIDSQALRASVAKALANGEDGASGADALAALEAKHGFNLDADISANLRGGAAGYLLPLAGLGLPNMGLIASVRDAAAFERGARGLFKALGEIENASFSVRESKYRDAPLWTVNFSAEGADPQLAAFLPSPTLAIVKDRVIVTLTKLRANKEIKRALGEEDEPHAVATAEARFPADAGFNGWMDWASTIDGLYGMGRSALAMFGGQLGLPIDLASLMTAMPESSRVFTRFFEPTTLTMRPVEGGYAMRWDTSFGPETWGSLIALGLGTTGSSRTTEEFDASMEIPGDEEGAELERAASEAREKRDATLNLLRALSSRLVVFKLDQSRYPASLDELSRPTTNYPRGFLEGLDVSVDAWGAPLRYTRAADGASYRLWSLGPNGTDENGEPDDLLAP
jgi:hypothetical protein